MKKLIYYLMTTLIAVFYINSLNSQAVYIPYGTSPVIDGTARHSEWMDADTIFLKTTTSGGEVEIAVLYKHDSVNFNFAFLGHLESSNVRFPEILMDVNHGHGSSWKADDWWFHVSATDCDYQGNYGLYDSCSKVRPNWKAMPNITNGSPITDTVEIQIPFSTIGFNFSNMDTLGLSFLVTNTVNSWDFWPSNADKDIPDTWGHAVFKAASSTGMEENHGSRRIKVYPNPGKGIFRIDPVNFRELEQRKFECIIFDMQGKEVFRQMLSFSNQPLTLNTGLNRGAYCLYLNSGDFQKIKKLFVIW